jgi:hypothetical protein
LIKTSYPDTGSEDIDRNVTPSVCGCGLLGNVRADRARVEPLISDPPPRPPLISWDADVMVRGSGLAVLTGCPRTGLALPVRGASRADDSRTLSTLDYIQTQRSPADESSVALVEPQRRSRLSNITAVESRRGRFTDSP